MVDVKKLQIAPSILAADFRFLEREVKAVEDAGAEIIHCDIMDGVFVPNISFGPMVVDTVKKCTSLPLDVHLMINVPQQYVRQFCDAGADTITVHADACENLTEVLDAIRGRGVGTGVTVNPDKPVSLFEQNLNEIDRVLIMSVYAGFGGQTFIAETLDKVRYLVQERSKRNLDFDIEIDGGINAETASICVQCGVNILVSGNYIYKSNDYRSAIANLRTTAVRE